MIHRWFWVWFEWSNLVWCDEWSRCGREAYFDPTYVKNDWQLSNWDYRLILRVIVYTQGSDRRLVEGLPEMVQKCCGRTGDRGKRFCLHRLDRLPCRDVPTTDIRWLQTPHTFYHWTDGGQPEHRWQPMSATVSHSGKWRRTQDYRKSQDWRCNRVQQVVETTRQEQGVRSDHSRYRESNGHLR